MMQLLVKTGVSLIEGAFAALAVLAFCQGHNSALLVSALGFVVFRTARLVLV